MLSLNEKLSEVQLLRLRETFHALPPLFANVNFTYVRTHVKITRQWKSTPKGHSPIFVQIFLDATFTPWHKLRHHKQRFWPWKTVSSHLKFMFQQWTFNRPSKKRKKLREKNWDAKDKGKRCNNQTPKVPKISSDYLDILFDYYLFLNSGSVRVLLTNCYLI